MSVQSCGQCSAPLPPAPAGAVIPCPYCGASNRIDAPPAAAPPPQPYGAPPQYPYRPPLVLPTDSPQLRALQHGWAREQTQRSRSFLIFFVVIFGLVAVLTLAGACIPFIVMRGVTDTFVPHR